MSKTCALALRFFALILAVLFAIGKASAQTPSPALIVLEKEDHALAVVDPSSLKVVGRVPIGPDPHEVAVTTDGKFAYASNYGANSTPGHTLSVVDLVAQKLLPAVDLGPLRAPHGVQGSDGKVYFTAEGSKSIGRIDPATNRVDWALGLGQNRTHMLVVRNGRIFTSNVNSDTIGVIDPDPKADVSDWRVSAIPVGKGPEGFDVSPDGSQLWAANSHDGTVSVIDVASRKVIATIPANTKTANRLKFTPDGARVFISDLGTGELVVMDVKTRSVAKRVALGKGIAGILIPPDGNRAFVADSRDNAILVLDLATLGIIGRIPTGRGPDGMAWAVRP
jgi:YVTN family beta-propeller protein